MNTSTGCIPIRLLSCTLPASEVYHSGCRPGDRTLLTTATAREIGDDLPYHPDKAALAA